MSVYIIRYTKFFLKKNSTAPQIIPGRGCATQMIYCKLGLKRRWLVLRNCVNRTGLMYRASLVKLSSAAARNELVVKGKLCRPTRSVGSVLFN